MVEVLKRFVKKRLLSTLVTNRKLGRLVWKRHESGSADPFGLHLARTVPYATFLRYLSKVGGCIDCQVNLWCSINEKRDAVHRFIEEPAEALVFPAFYEFEGTQ